MSELKKLLGKRVATMRNNMKYTQMQLAEKVDMSASAIAEIETGVTFPKPETIEKLREVFNCEYIDLFNFHDNKTIDTAYKEAKESLDYLYKNNSELIPAVRLFMHLIKK